MMDSAPCNPRSTHRLDPQPGHNANPGVTALLPRGVFACLPHAPLYVKTPVNRPISQPTDKSNKFDGRTRAVANHILFALIRIHPP